MANPDILTVNDIADERGWHRTTAWRWLKRVAAQFGSEIVWEDGGKLVTTHAALESIKDKLPAPPDRRILRRLAALEQSHSEQSKRLNGVARDVAELRRKSHEWLSRRG